MHVGFFHVIRSARNTTSGNGAGNWYEKLPNNFSYFLRPNGWWTVERLLISKTFLVMGNWHIKLFSYALVRRVLRFCLHTRNLVSENQNVMWLLADERGQNELQLYWNQHHFIFAYEIQCDQLWPLYVQMCIAIWHGKLVKVVNTVAEIEMHKYDLHIPFPSHDDVIYSQWSIETLMN